MEIIPANGKIFIQDSVIINKQTEGLPKTCRIMYIIDSSLDLLLL